MTAAIQPILDRQPVRMEAVEGLREMLLANAVMLGEIPAPTFSETARIRFLRDRFNEAGLEHVSIDEMGNTAAVLPGKTGERTILVTANADSVFFNSVDHAMTLQTGKVIGPGIAENAIGLATLSLLPILLERLGIELDANLVLLGTTRSLGLGDIEGIRFFLSNYKKPIDFGICLRGVHLGRLSYQSLGMIRGEVTVTVPDSSEWRRIGSGGSILFLNRIVSRILEIPLKRQPRSAIILGSISSGNTFNSPAQFGTLRFEIRSEEEEMPDRLLAAIQLIVDECDAENEVDVALRTVARRRLGGIPFSHPLVRAVRQITDSLAIESVIAPSTGELCAMIDAGFPGVTLGLTTVENHHQVNETIAVDPLFRGVVQLLSLLESIDCGACDAEN